MESRPPLPPFTLESATKKVQAAEDAWNTRDPVRVSLAYTPDTEWRNRADFVNGREQVEEFLTRTHSQLFMGHAIDWYQNAVKAPGWYD